MGPDLQNHRMIEAIRDLCRSSSPCPTSLPEQGLLEQVAQDGIQLDIECLQRWRLHYLAVQSVTMIYHAQSKDSPPYVYIFHVSRENKVFSISDICMS